MAFDIRKAEARLQNIQAVTPVLAALRTISLGSWRTSMTRSQHLTRYTDRLLALLPYLLPHTSLSRISGKRWLPFKREGDHVGDRPEGGSVVAVVLGSERGLCGQYNNVLIDRFASYLQKREEEDAEISVIAFGSRLIRELQRQDYELDLTRALSVTRLPSYKLAREFVDRWLSDYESYAIDAVDMLYNAEVEAGDYEPTSFRLIPPSVSASDIDHPSTVSLMDENQSRSVIIETDPVGIYARIIKEWTITTAYELMLEAAGTEHAARYQLMESATQNAEELIETLSRDIKTGRRREITQEMQELAVAAGLLNG